MGVHRKRANFVPLLCVGAVGAVLLFPSHSAASSLVGPVDAHMRQPHWRTLAWPARGTVTDGFGMRWGRLHNGVDIGILRSPHVVAAAPGIVRRIGYLNGYEGYGLVVVIDVGGGYTTMYAHLAQVRVGPGRWVAAGQRIGVAGCSGSCTGTHLHFELRLRGRPLDPLPRLNRPPAARSVRRVATHARRARDAWWSAR